MNEASAINSMILKPREIVQTAYDINRFRQHMRDNPGQKAELDERIRNLKTVYDPLRRECDENEMNLMDKRFRSVENLLQSVAKRSKSLWAFLYCEENHENLRQAAEEFVSLHNEVSHLKAKYQLAHTNCRKKLDTLSTNIGIHRSLHVLRFLKASTQSKQQLRVIVIYGQAGLGKTTILNTVWQNAALKPPFGNQAYLELPNNPNPNHDEIMCWQSSICEQLGEKKEKFSSEKFGQSALRDCFLTLKNQEKPIFLAIDNVVKEEQLTRLLPDELAEKDMPSYSCIAVTSRDHSIGHAICRIFHLEANNSLQVLYFEPVLLNFEDSKKLFAEDAGIELSSPAHKDLLDALVPLCGGLPLALKILGNIFRKEELREHRQWVRIQHQWNTFDDSDDNHTSKVTKALRISYDLLPSSRQMAFLDIISSFYGWPWEIVEGIVGMQKVEVLRQSSLISKVDSRNHFSQSALRSRSLDMEKSSLESCSKWISGYVWVHELTLRFGESIINDEHSCQVNRLGYAEFRKHHLGYVERPFTGISDLLKVTNVRNLILRISPSTSLTEISSLLSELECATKLQTLIVHQEKGNSPSMIKFRLGDSNNHDCLRYFSHAGDWAEAWSDFLKNSPKIRFIKLDDVDDNIISPSSSCPGSSNLKPSSMNFWLPSISVTHPLPVTEHRELEFLHVLGCGNPQEIGNIPSLKSWRFTQCPRLTQLPESVGCMKSLEELLLECCPSLVKLAGFVTQPSLHSLRLKLCASLTKLPESVECMKFLEELLVEDCSKLEELPANIGKLRSLKKFHVNRCSSLKELPDFVECMESLEEMEVHNCSKLTRLPSDMGKLRSLKKFHLTRCPRLTKLWNSVECMESLQELVVDNCSRLDELPADVGKLRFLKKFHLTECHRLKKLPEVFSESGEGMVSLEELVVKHCNILEELPAGIGKLPSLKKLQLKKCPNLKKLPESVKCMESLEELALEDCVRLEQLPADIGKLRSLGKLYVINCLQLTSLPEFEESMESLEELVVHRCNSLEKLPPNIGKLVSLKKFYLVSCLKLARLPESLIHMKSLKELVVADCKSIEDLPAGFQDSPALDIFCFRSESMPLSVRCVESPEDPRVRTVPDFRSRWQALEVYTPQRDGS